MSRHTHAELSELQSYPLEMKIKLTKARIREWIREYGEDGVYVAFSGGKDSTVLLDIVRQDYPSVPGVFADTGLEYPEIRQFVMSKPNVVMVKPEKNFRDIVIENGYPFISKEVSSCVRGAKKYLKELDKWEAEHNAPTDRQTDRQTVSELPYSYCFDRLQGRGRYAKATKKKQENGDFP